MPSHVRTEHRSRAARAAVCTLALLLVALPAATWASPAGANAAGTWAPVASMGESRVGLAATAGRGNDERVYALGGNGDTTNVAKASAEAYIPDTDTWLPLPPMTTARVNFAAVTGTNGRIYAIGGNRSGPTSLLGGGDGVGVGEFDMEVYDPATNAWQGVEPALLADGSPNPEYVLGRSTGRQGLAAVTGTDGRIYAMGGGDDVTVAPGTTAVEVFDPANPDLGWVDLAPMASPRNNFGAAVGSDGRIYAVGGVSGAEAAVEIYDPLTNAWTAGPAMPHPRRYGVRVVSDTAGRIHAIGGYWDPPFPTSLRAVVNMYDPAQPALGWTVAGSMSSPREHGAATSGPAGRIFAMGGFNAGVDLATADAYSPAAAPPTHQVADFDGNGSTDVSVYRPSEATWYVKDGDSVPYGTDGDLPIPADYDGDGLTDVAIFRPSTGLWAIHNSQSGTDRFVTYGIGSDTPVPADYDGDGKADIAIFRADYGTWWVNQSSTGTDVATTFGIDSDVPVPGLYDNDDKADLAIFRDGTWFVLPTTGGAYTATNYGTAGDIPTPGDYDGDGKTDTAIFRPANGAWAIHHSSDNSNEAFAFGNAGDIPVAGDYDDDGTTDAAVFAPASGQWSVKDGLSTGWGSSGDIPLPIPYAIFRTVT